MYCKNCGKPIDDDAKFCPHCGSNVLQTNTQDELIAQQAHDDWRAQMAQRLGHSSPNSQNAAPRETAHARQKSAKPIENIGSANAYSVPYTDTQTIPAASARKKKKPIFKRWWFWVIVVVVILAVLGSSGDNSDSDSDPNDRINQEETTSTATSAPEITISETVVYDNNGVKITATGFAGDSIFGKEIKLLVENNTNKNIAVSGNDFIINGITISGFLYAEVAAGKKTNDTIILYSSDLDYAGIKEIATLNAPDAHIVDTDTYAVLFDAPFIIETSASSTYSQPINKSGTVLFEQANVTVVSQIISDTIYGNTVRIYVANNSENDIIIQGENVSVNGFTTTAWMYDVVYAGTVRYCDLDLFSSGLEENGIKKIEEVTFTVSIINPTTYHTIASSNELLITVSD